MASNNQPRSRYVPLEIPKFKCTIDKTVLNQLPDDQRYLVETLSEMEEREKWLVTNLKENNRINLETDERLSALEARVTGYVIKTTVGVLVVLLTAIARWWTQTL